MSSRALFKDKQLRLCVVTTLAAGPVVSTAEALLLPPKPLAFSSTWDCRSGSDNDWLCRTSTGLGYSESLESVTQDRLPSVEQSYSYRPLDSERPDYKLTQARVASVNPLVADRAILQELLNAPGESYVLQWLSANDRTSLDRLKAKNPILQDSTIASYQRAGRKWFILLDGPFPSRIAAMTALKQEPRASIAAKFYPWTRSIASIQQLNFIQSSRIAGYDTRYPKNRETSHQQKRTRIPVPQQTIQAYHRENQASEDYYEARARNNKATQFPILPDSVMAEQERGGYSAYPEGYDSYSRGPVYLNRSIADANYIVSTKRPNRYEVPHNYIDADPNLQQEPRYVVQPSQRNNERSYLDNNHYNYNTSQYPQARQEAGGQVFYNPDALTDRYLNDLKYATASTSQQIIIPPINNQPKDYYGSIALPPNYGADDIRQVNYNGQTLENYDYRYNTTRYQQERRPQPLHRQDYVNPIARPEEANSAYQNQAYADTALNAPPGSYTIQWLAANNKESLERIQLRYPILQNTQIIHYQKRNADWYVLVGGSFVSREAAQSALSLPPYSKLTARLYPWVRSVEALQKLVAGTPRKRSLNYQQHDLSFNDILSGDENNYTIQWYAANQVEAVKRMKNRFPELANAVTVHFRRNKKDWYILLQGQYNTSQDAIAAIKSPAMKKAARMLHPWTRPLNTLKNLHVRERS